MERQWNRALIVSLIMILSSMAGCLDADDDIAEPLPGDNIEDTNTNNTTSNDVVEIQPFGNVMVSTYHVGELVSAVAGEYVTMEYMSQSNIPVHDYDPTVEDIVRLQNSDLFFYHGLNLEPWVDSTLSSLGENAPPSFMTHAMPTGGITLDYESMLISDLCEHLSEGPYENTTLGIDDDGMLPEIHAEHNAHSFSFPVIDDDHDDHNETDDHDDHDDHNETDDHDDHDGHNETDDHDDHDGHNHAEAEKIIENPEACPTNTVISIFHLEEGEHTIEFISEEGVSFNMVALKMNGGHAHDHHEHDGHNETDDHKENEMICYNINSHQIDEQYTNQTDCETAGLMWTERSSGPGDHDDHDDHEGVCHNTTTHENYESNESDCEAAGHVWMEDDEHDEHEGVCHNTTTHENYESNESDCEAAGHVWMEDDEHDEHEGV
ncbi:MAG: metal ABC transporter substrate-binding protein, partial [Candidatus Thalassarchaeaceae archaeon]